MKFIRDIIKEKRRAEPQDAPVEPLETLRREPVAETAPPSAFAMTNFDDDTFDIARPARKDPEEDFDLFAEDDDDDFEPWQPRAEQAAPAPEPVAAVQEEEETAAEDYAFEENLEEEETSEAEDAFDVEAFDEDEPFAQEPSEDSDQFEASYEDEDVDSDAAQAPYADGPVFEDDEDTFAPAEPAPAPQVDADSLRAAVRASTAELPPMPAVTRVTQTAQPEPMPEAMPTPVAEAQVQMPPPAAGRGANRSGRVKTRLLGFAPGTEPRDPFAAPESAAAKDFPVGWMVVVAGPGRGASFPLYDGVSRVGRGDDQTVSLNFGDNSISRENHISIAYDAEDNTFYVGHSGKSNLVRLNRKPLLSTEQLTSGDQIRLGETTLRFVALCGDGFSWSAGDAGVRRNAG